MGEFRPAAGAGVKWAAPPCKRKGSLQAQGSRGQRPLEKLKTCETLRETNVRVSEQSGQQNVGGQIFGQRNVSQRIVSQRIVSQRIVSQRNVGSAKCRVNDMSGQRIVSRQIVSQRNVGSAKCLVNEMSGSTKNRSQPKILVSELPHPPLVRGQCPSVTSCFD